MDKIPVHYIERIVSSLGGKRKAGGRHDKRMNTEELLWMSGRMS